MISSTPDGLLGADDLRRAFDETFASALPPRLADPEPFLLLRLGKDAHAVRIRDIRGFAAARRIVPLAGAGRDLLGIAGFRGSLVPVYDLAALLGYDDRSSAPRWFILCGDQESVAFAFEAFDGYVERLEEGGERAGTRDVLRDGGLTRIVIDVPSLVETVKKNVGMGARPDPLSQLGPSLEPKKNPKEP